MRVNRWFAVAGIVVLAAAVTIGCGGSSGGSSQTSGKTRKIFVFTPFPTGVNDVTRAWNNGWRQGATDLGDGFDVQVKAEGQIEPDAAPFLNFINTALVQKPDGIVVVPNNAAAMAAGLKKIAAGGTKVLLMDQDVAGMTDKVSFVGTDNRQAGRLAADWMVKQARAGKMRSPQVAILGSTPGISSTDDRQHGFQHALAGSPLKVVATALPTCDDPAKARATMADVLSAHPGLGGVYSVCDQIATGAAQALKAAGQLDVQAASVDASKQGVQLIVSHQGIDAEVAQHLLRMGRTAVTTLGHAIQGRQVPKRIDTGVELVTEHNAQAYLQRAAVESK